MNKKRLVYETEWFSIEEEYFDRLKSLRGKPYYRIQAPDGVVLLAMTENRDLILVKQFRPALNQYTLEFPSGEINKMEVPKDAAVRELYEETGYVCQTLVPVGRGRAMLNRLNSQEYAFFGTGAVKDPGFKAKEDIEVLLVSRNDFKNLVLAGKFEQLSGLAVLVFSDWKLKGEVLGEF